MMAPSKTHAENGRPVDSSASAVVSIVIPVYNTERYLDRCLDSVLSQTFADIEVICIDDGSSDGSGAALDARAAADSRLRVFHRDNAGAAASRNVGLDLARGEYVLFVDSDDYIESHSCEVLVAEARRTDADIVVFGGRTFPSVDWIDRCLSTRDVVYEADSFGALLEENGSYPLMCNKFYRRSFLEADGLRFNESLVLGEDNAFQFLAFPRARTVAFMSAALYHYRCEREGSAIASHYGDLAGKVAKHFDVVSFVAEEWRKNGFIAGHKARFLDWILFFLFDDAKDLSFSDRIDLTGRLGSLLDSCGLAAEDCSPAMRPIASFMLQGVSQGAGPERDVAVTVLLRSLGQSEDEVKRGFLHLANQSEQRLEFFIVDDAEGRAQACAAALAPDDRIAVAAHVGDALGRARGRYVLFADFDDEYDWDALATLTAAVEEERVVPDVAIMRDVLGRLRMADVSRQVVEIGATKDGAGERARKHYVFHLADLADLALSFSSLDACNKLWSIDFVRRCGRAGWDASSIAHMLLAADVAVVHKGTLCEKKAIGAQAGEAMSRALDELSDLRAAFEAEDRPEAYRAQVNGLVLSTGMRIVEAAPTLAQARAAAQRLLPYVGEQGVLTCLPDSLYAAEDDYKAVLSLQGNESLDEALFDRLVAAKRRDGGYIQALENRLEACEEELACVYDSLSFKVGRKITLIPRKMRDMIARA